MVTVSVVTRSLCCCYGNGMCVVTRSSYCHVVAMVTVCVVTRSSFYVVAMVTVFVVTRSSCCCYGNGMRHQ